MSAPATVTSAATRPRAVAREVPAGRRPGWWGMVLTLVTDVAAFAALLAAYFYVRFVTTGADWPPGDIADPKLLKAWIMTALLVTSSAPLVFADLGIKKGRRGRLLVGVGLTLLLGAAFLYVQYSEYTEKLTTEFTPQTNAYGSLFFVITGFHGLHVVLGVLTMLVVFVAGATGRITRKHHAVVRIAGLYWHTVGAVWVFIFASLYLAAQL
ncbi:heme-copper oxidase subunit III [Geodermatophilus sp. TF02-6]|uniref:cytochrome c oxidase subunit 3 n=1 Tax=Geodermatophilus sp. TF02-6 TaxID=2250575 RepID=UPI000DE81576|nr:cytochrome c oxidase subunit 3 [Geodermatophilus sp. TF02-6]RBY82376.1 heme-copper oxidase subunit III [Geodermatophilus sp. TF02-6]